MFKSKKTDFKAKSITRGKKTCKIVSMHDKGIHKMSNVGKKRMT
jgi:hypothetical protein